MDPKMAPLFQEYPQTQDEANLRAWLKTNKATFTEQGWTPAEVAHMALNVGFDPAAIYAILSHGQNAIDGVRSENRAALQFFLFEEAIEHVSALNEQAKAGKTVGLADSWDALIQYQTQGESFKEAA